MNPDIPRDFRVYRWVETAGRYIFGCNQVARTPQQAVNAAAKAFPSVYTEGTRVLVTDGTGLAPYTMERPPDPILRARPGH